MSTINRMLMLALKEALQIVRDRATLGMVLGVPLLQFILFGFAVELTPRTLSVTAVASQGERAARMSDGSNPDLSARALAVPLH